MSRAITIAIEGQDADRALAELLAIPGVQGEAQPREEAAIERDGGALVAIGAVVAIAQGVAAIVDSIITWREKWKAEHPRERFSVVIEDARGNRLSLEHATPEQVTAALRTLAA